MAITIHWLHGGDYAREEFELKDDRKAVAACGGRPKGDP
jgi:hypothetical protein